MDRSICQALNLDSSESVEVLLRICRRQNNLNGLIICREAISQTEGSENWLDGSKKLSRICREETQKSRWIEIPLRSIEKKRKKGSIEENLLRSCRA